jgi:NTP pyrophosphatase (non-canonical NTP hydrolase)
VDDLRIIQGVSARRSARWHHQDTVPWSLADWSNAMCGEAGEAANVVKKIRRIETGTVGVHNGGETDLLTLRAKLGEELADTVLYAVLVADEAGVDLATHVVAKFNAVSVASGFPERIG